MRNRKKLKTTAVWISAWCKTFLEKLNYVLFTRNWKPIVLAILNYVQLYVFSVSIKYLNEKHCPKRSHWLRFNTKSYSRAAAGVNKLLTMMKDVSFFGVFFFQYLHKSSSDANAITSVKPSGFKKWTTTFNLKQDMFRSIYDWSSVAASNTVCDLN